MTTAIAKAVFDTNILVSGHFWKGPPYRCLVAAEAGVVRPVLTDPIASELREKLTEKFRVPTEAVDAVIDRLKARAEYVHVQGRSGWVTQDPDDDKFIDVALASGATIIVSGDRHLLALGSVDLNVVADSSTPRPITATAAPRAGCVRRRLRSRARCRP